jgi:hypothetical protein
MRRFRSWYQRAFSPLTRVWLRDLRRPGHWGFHIRTLLLEFALADYRQAQEPEMRPDNWFAVTRRGVLQQMMAMRVLEPLRPFLTPHLDFDHIANLMPNSGGVPVAQRFDSAHAIVAAFDNPEKRSLGHEEYAGFAVDDAVFDEASQSWELWSNAELAGWLAHYACRRFGNPTILELGCGPAHLFFFFRSFGLLNYLGIDGNPYFLKFNRLLHGYENHFLLLNLQDRIQLAAKIVPIKFDLICSLEVLEHIREDRLDNLLWTVTQHMHPQSIFIGSASLQPNMDVHVLVRPKEWWLDRFCQHGLVPAPDHDRLGRQIMAHRPFNWSGENTNIFVLQRAD